ncbi:hypothetical protein JTB14_014715 [Gonioctena quinquepunctata]|nr:hypothetical protein JTB14_014715 [Gonioctena quinquepunctata]
MIRGLNPGKLIECKMWWTGPAWMSQEKSFWPKADIWPNSEIPELKKTDSSLISVIETQDINIIDRFSSFTRLLRS